MIVVYRFRWVGNFTADGVEANIPPAVSPNPDIVVTIVGVGPLSYADIRVDTGTGPLDPNTLEDMTDYLAPLGWAYVETNPTTPLCPIQVRFAPEYNNDKGDFKVHYIASGGSSHFSFAIPKDFVSLVKLVMVAIPNNTTVNEDIDLSSDYGKSGEPYNAHSESNTTLLWSATADEITEFDISSVFSAIEAGDECGLFLDQNGITGGVNYLWVLLEYVNTP